MTTRDDSNNICKHENCIIYNNTNVCEDCGLQSNECKIMYNDIELSSASNNSLTQYLEDLPPEKKNKIIKCFDEISKDINFRSEGKRGILAACFFFILRTDYGEYYTFNDIKRIFNIEKRKFCVGKQLFLNKYKEHRIYDINISDYLLNLFDRFGINNFMVRNDMIRKCKNLNENEELVNFNPFAVCSCFVYKYLYERDDKIKKSMFIKDIGMSEITINKILNCL